MTQLFIVTAPSLVRGLTLLDSPEQIGKIVFYRLIFYQSAHTFRVSPDTLFTAFTVFLRDCSDPSLPIPLF